MLINMCFKKSFHTYAIANTGDSAFADAHNDTHIYLRYLCLSVYVFVPPFFLNFGDFFLHFWGFYCIFGESKGPQKGVEGPLNGAEGP